ncbi:hypothetical protein LWI29_029827 [Acer saccharum]|uniref:Uncharacterized protein n=1 Tax=Acer saccharum TaxID=4024 RepID=A0AA39T7E4_ACESA|nr:hypothetical protein LWI29_029827 [Acer saccharum]
MFYTASVNGLDQVELNSQDKLLAIIVDDHQEGESAPSERQVSPEKLYCTTRAKSVISKAEKLRIEREELARRQREEKARWQADAKAAEVA